MPVLCFNHYRRYSSPCKEDASRHLSYKTRLRNSGDPLRAAAAAKRASPPLQLHISMSQRHGRIRVERPATLSVAQASARAADSERTHGPEFTITPGPVAYVTHHSYSYGVGNSDISKTTIVCWDLNHGRPSSCMLAIAGDCLASPSRASLHTRLPARGFATHLRAAQRRRDGGATSSEIHRIRGIALAYRIVNSENRRDPISNRNLSAPLVRKLCTLVL